TWATSVPMPEGAWPLLLADGGVWQLAGEETARFGLVNDYLGYLADRNYSSQTVRAYGFGLLAFCRWLVEQRIELVVCPSNNWQWVGMISGVSKPVPAMSVTDAQREVLESLPRPQSGPHREVVRAKALMMAADGASNATIAARLSVSRSTVANWRTR